VPKRGKKAEDHGQLSLFAEEVPKWLLPENDLVLDPYRCHEDSGNESRQSDSCDDLDELVQFSDWLKLKEGGD
jgi:hypothetical protein